LTNNEHLNLSISSLISSGRSLVRQDSSLPRKTELTNFKIFLLNKFSNQYARLQYSYVMKYGNLIDNPNEINSLPLSIRSNVMKSLINYSKYLGKYESFKSQLKNYGIKWVSTDNCFNSFLAIINNNHSTLGSWYIKALKAVSENEKLWLKFTLLTGLRKAEAINSFNLIIKLAGEGKLSEYFNEEQGILEHFKYGTMFLRNSKNVYISIVTKQLMNEVAGSEPVYYTTIRKHLQKNKLRARIKELRSYYATYLRKKGILAEYVDLLQGRIPKSVFARHYLKVEDVKELVKHVLTVTDSLIESLEPIEA
jgi:intergrase/recombinase